MNGSCNLALLSPQERLAVQADKLACQYRHRRKEKGKEWRQWVVEQMAKLTPEMRDAVRERLNARSESNAGAGQAKDRPAQQDRRGIPAAS